MKLKSLCYFWLVVLVGGLLALSLSGCDNSTTNLPTPSSLTTTSSTTTGVLTGPTSTAATTATSSNVVRTSTATTLAPTPTISLPTLTPTQATSATTTTAPTPSASSTTLTTPLLPEASVISSPSGFLKGQLDNFNQSGAGSAMQAYKITSSPEKVITAVSTTFELAGWVNDTPEVVLTKNAQAVKNQDTAASLTFVKEAKMAFVIIYPFQVARKLGINEVAQTETLFLVGVVDN